jgi:homopolymeric O-antigen transport system ATP-binding protein
MSDIAIRVENLGKRYRIGERHRYKALRDTLSDALYAPFRVAASMLNGHNGHRSIASKRSSSDFWALKDISFEIKQGEAVGIIGRNGAGKSTLLKILSRITKPTEGYVRMHGRVGSLLEVGTGFHPELTGRENVYLNSAIIGMRKKEIDRKFDEIVAFAEIEKFIDTPVKLYSSGMYVRLAFGVAAHLEPEILLVDEVLAVGDAAFQKKCLGKMNDVAKTGRTVLFVSHNMGAIQRLCERTIWIESGRVKKDKPTGDVIENYLREMQDNYDRDNIVSRDGNLIISKVTTRNEVGQEKKNFLTGEALRIEFDYQCTRDFDGAFIYIGIANSEALLFAANMSLDGCRVVSADGQRKLSVTFKELPLAPQQHYYIRIGGRASDNKSPLFTDPYIDVGKFQVIGSTADISLKGKDSEMLIANTSSVLVPYEWDLGNGQRYKIDSFKNVKLLGREAL